MNKNYRVHTNISQDTVLNVNMRQDFDLLEVLSLELSQDDAYRLHSSNYGVIIGRVLANEAFGIPNARVSVFIPRDQDDTKDIEALYPYASTSSKDNDGRRYNLLPDYSDDDCYRVVGTFPSKTLVLNNDTYLDVYDKYYRYSTVTNHAGDYMIFGVPTGMNEIHVDIDLSDIGVLSQKPRDFEYKGYDINLFDNPNQFKESTNIDSLAQIISQNKTINVYPFWCDEDEGVAAITRCDIEVQYKFEPTCVFMGSIMTDNDSNSIGHDCRPSRNSGMNRQLVAGEGTIEMIRKTTDGLTEEFQIQGNQLIDSNGVWCYQIPMNLDYVGTDEYGNIVATDNPSKGIPTRARVRFRISKNEPVGGSSYHTAKLLVPMNPEFSPTDESPTIKQPGADIEQMYQFGSSTPLNCFRDLYWNNVYSVKSYIPRIQNRIRIPIANYNGIKGSNLAEDQNQVPFNKLRVDVPFTYLIVCVLFTIVMVVVMMINTIICAIDAILKVLFMIFDIGFFGIHPFRWIRRLLGLDYIGCIPLSAGMNEGNVAYYPGCSCTNGLHEADCPDDMPGCKKDDSKADLEDQVQRNLAQEYDIIKLDFYNDWLNGALYMPLWHWKRSRKKKFLFFTIRSAQDTFCNCNKLYGQLRNAMSCAFGYKDANLELPANGVPENEKKWHKVGSYVGFKHGVIKEVKNKDDLSVYYYAAVDATEKDKNPTMAMIERDEPFKAVRLYATDIILLGNLDENNIYGIPQFFRNLPSTTANIPPIATTLEIANETDGYSKTDSIKEEEVEGVVSTTGMDWGHGGGGDRPRYKNGLFMDLACTYVNTRAKSCINAERLSEYGMSLDMTHSMPYSTGGDIKYGEILQDGVINKVELSSLDERAAFATMNHNGFIPQEYQEKTGSYTTEVEDDGTNYLVPKMQYLYPVDLDGRFKEIMAYDKNGFEQYFNDNSDEDYKTFRLGARRNNNNNPGDYGRMRHIYNTGATHGKQLKTMPLYNNSFYFYFGIKKGSTAIDKFNKLFDAQCFKNNKIPFSLIVDQQNPAYCPSSYPDGMVDLMYPYIRVKLDDISVPYAYTLYDSRNRIVVTEGDMDALDFVIGGFLENGDVKINKHNNQYSVIRNQKEPKDLVLDNNGKPKALSAQTYKLVIVDANGRGVTERVDLDYQYLSFDYVSTNLGMKYIDENATPKEIVCDGFNGSISLEDIVVDGYNLKLSGTPSYSYVGKKLSILNLYAVSATTEDNNTEVHYALPLSIEFENESSDDDIIGCLCGNPSFDAETGKFVFKVYKPLRYMLTISQMCEDEGGVLVVTDNSLSAPVNIRNGVDFDVSVNTVPMRFMIGDSSTVTESHFYTSGNVVTEIYTENSGITQSMQGWLYPNDEGNYLFPDPFSDNGKDTWNNYIQLYQNIDTPPSYREMIAKKLEWMFKLSEGVFLTNDSSGRFVMSAVGGVQPTLYRVAHPDYSEYNDAGVDYDEYIVDDVNIISCDVDMPNIVTSNYTRLVYDGRQLPDEVMMLDDAVEEIGVENYVSGFTFNALLYADEADRLGNYMAAFTNDGGYISNTEVSDERKFQRGPWLAEPNGYSVKPKNKTRHVLDLAGDYDYVYAEGHNYLRGQFVDRRFDYDLIMIGPVNVPNDYQLPGGAAVNGDGKWKNARLFGQTYNGIEMSYDENYNIISGNCSVDSGTGIVSAVTSNNALEYSYQYSGVTGDPEDRRLSPKSVLNLNPTVSRKPYEAYVNNTDLLTLNEWENVPSGLTGDTSYSNRYESLVFGNNNSKYYAQGVYPTVRDLNVWLEPSVMYTFGNVGCSYRLSPEITEDGYINVFAVPGETTEVDFEFNNIVLSVPPKDEEGNINELYGGLEFRNYSALTYTTLNVSGSGIDLQIKVNSRDYGMFDVYQRNPRLLAVTKHDQPNYNGYLELRKAKDYKGLNSILSGISKEFDVASCPDGYKEDVIAMNADKPMIRRDGKTEEYMSDLPNDLKHCIFNEGENTYAPSRDAGFTGTIFKYDNNISIEDGNSYAILLDEEWFYTANDGLKRCIRVMENTPPFDMRPFKMHYSGGTYNFISGDTENSQYQETTLVFVVDPPESGENQTITSFNEVKRVTAWFRSNKYEMSIGDVINFEVKAKVEKNLDEHGNDQGGFKFTVFIGKELDKEFNYNLEPGSKWKEGARFGTADYIPTITFFFRTKDGMIYHIGGTSGTINAQDVNRFGFKVSSGSTQSDDGIMDLKFMN